MNPEDKPGHMDDIDSRVQATTHSLSLIADMAERIVVRLHGPDVIIAREASHEASPAVDGSIRRILQSIDTLNAVAERLERHVTILTDL